MGIGKQVEYEQTLVSYVDVLGFERLVQTKSANEISRTLRIFNETTAPPRFKRKMPDVPRQDQISFSDLTMTCTPLTGKNLEGIVFNQFLRLVYAQATLLVDERLLIRGGIAAGLAVKTNRQYYGPAIIDAYKCEQTKPGYPRIIVAASVLEEVSKNERLWLHDRSDELQTIENFLAREEDGTAYIDYLRVVLGESEDPDWVLQKHVEFIDSQLKEFARDDDVRRKYQWLADYHQRTVEKL